MPHTAENNTMVAWGADLRDHSSFADNQALGDLTPQTQALDLLANEIIF